MEKKFFWNFFRVIHEKKKFSWKFGAKSCRNSCITIIGIFFWKIPGIFLRENLEGIFQIHFLNKFRPKIFLVENFDEIYE